MLLKIVIFFVLGVLIGYVACLIIRNSHTRGTLVIDTRDMEKDIYRFEVDDLGDLDKRKRILLKIEKRV